MRSFHYDHVHIAPSHQITLHGQPTWELSYVIVGEGERTIGDNTEPFRSGEVVLVVPGMPHRWAFNPEKTDAQGMVENITLTFSDDFLDRLMRDIPELRESVSRLKSLSDSIRFVKETASELSDILRRMDSQPEPSRVLSLLQILVLMADSDECQVVGHSRNEADAERRMRMIDTYVRCNFKREIPVDEISRYVGMNRSAFCVFFKRMTGSTFVAYLNKFRLTHARYLLASSSLGIAQVCYQSGFNDVPYFHRLFKRTEGVTPSEYRRMAATASP